MNLPRGFAAPRDFEKWNPALRGAFLKGWQVGRDGLPCRPPYADKRKQDGRLTWSRAFESAWSDGWRLGDDARRSDHITQYITDARGHGQPQGNPR